MKSYKRVGAVKTMLKILKFLAEQREPMSGAAMANRLNMAHGTVMCYLATLEDEGLVRTVGEYFEIGMGMALFWAHKKAKLEAEKARLKREFDLLGVD